MVTETGILLPGKRWLRGWHCSGGWHSNCNNLAQEVPELGIVGGWTTPLNGTVTPLILMGPVPGAFWPFCCQAAVIQDITHLVKLVGSDGYENLQWFATLQGDNILPDDEPSHLVREADVMCVASAAVAQFEEANDSQGCDHFICDCHPEIAWVESHEYCTA